MTTRNNTAVSFRMALLAAAVICAAGCSSSPGGKGTSEESAWTPDPQLVDQLKQAVEAGDFRLSLPLKFTAIDVPRGLPAGMKMSAWKGEGKAGEAPPTLSVSAFSDGKVVKEAANMRQFLVNYSAGVTESTGIKISRREATESGQLGGIGFSRFKWSGTAANGTDARGVVYGAIDNGRVIAIIAMCFGTSAETQNKLMEAAIATFKRR